MSLVGQFELEVELKSPANALWNTVKNINVLYPKLFPEDYESVEILEGDGKSAGTIRLVTYAKDNYGLGKTDTSKIEYIDEDKKTICYRVLDGRTTWVYESFQETTTVKPAAGGGKGSVVVWSCKYEKLAEEVQGPEVTKDAKIQLFHKLDEYTLASINANN